MSNLEHDDEAGEWEGLNDEEGAFELDGEDLDEEQDEADWDDDE
jgi:hypothetical protein